VQRSFLKWPGSKHQILSKIFKKVPRTGELLIEPFAGSCSLALNTDYKNYILNDVNVDLTSMYKYVVSDPDKFIQDAKELFVPENNIEARYYEIRDEFNNETNQYRRSQLFHWIMWHCYNGLCRYNLSGGFNSPFGTYKDPKIQEDAIYFFARKFKNAKFTSLSFTELMSETFSDAVLFCDPPYLPKSKTSSFVQYAPVPFPKENHRLLDALGKKSSSQSNKVFICNNRVPDVGKYYTNNTSHINYFVKRSIGAKKSSRKNVKETLLIYGD